MSFLFSLVRPDFRVYLDRWTSPGHRTRLSRCASLGRWAHWACLSCCICPTRRACPAQRAHPACRDHPGRWGRPVLIVVFVQVV